MNKMIMAHKILEDLRKGLKGKSIKHARFEVGELADISPEDLEAQLKECADFDFLVEEKKAKVKCRCGYEGMAEILDRNNGDVVFTCSKCGDIPEILEGGEVKIAEVEVKE
ncbi:hydrogenase/urease maturation nickel metallochaperone HypA [Thermoproteota archaeon]